MAWRQFRVRFDIGGVPDAPAALPPCPGHLGCQGRQPLAIGWVARVRAVLACRMAVGAAARRTTPGGSARPQVFAWPLAQTVVR